MSIVGGEKIKALDLKTKEKDQPMVVTSILRYEPDKPTGKPLYRLSGISEKNGHTMSRICSETLAQSAAKELNISISTGTKKEKAPSKSVPQKEKVLSKSSTKKPVESKVVEKKPIAPKKEPVSKPIKRILKAKEEPEVVVESAESSDDSDLSDDSSIDSEVLGSSTEEEQVKYVKPSTKKPVVKTQAAPKTPTTPTKPATKKVLTKKVQK